MANGAFFMTPEQALAAERQMRESQVLAGGGTPLGASAQELGRTMAGGISQGLFGAPALDESPAVQMARTRSTVLQNADLGSRAGAFEAAKALRDAGDMEGFMQLTKHGLSITPPETGENWVTTQSGNLLLRTNRKTNRTELIAKLDTDVGGGDGGKPIVDIVTPANLEVLGQATQESLPDMYDLSNDKDGQDAYKAAYGQAVKDLAAAARNAKVPLTLGEIQDSLKSLLAQPGQMEGFGKYEIDDFGRNSFDTDLFRADVAELRNQLFGATSGGGGGAAIPLEQAQPDGRVALFDPVTKEFIGYK